jgi:heme/copper-type cytochrome/quinol oxidase subunit 1
MYQKWNTFASFGSLISFFGLIFFFYVVYDALTQQIPCGRNPWIFSTHDEMSYRMTRLSYYVTNNFVANDYKVNKRFTTLDNKYYQQWLLYNYISHLKYVINLKNIKTFSLEWTLPSPVPAHTFAVAPKIITVSSNYKKYRKNYYFRDLSNPKNKKYILPFGSGMDADFDVLVEVFYSTTRKNI